MRRIRFGALAAAMSLVAAAVAAMAAKRDNTFIVFVLPVLSSAMTAGDARMTTCGADRDSVTAPAFVPGSPFSASVRPRQAMGLKSLQASAGLVSRFRSSHEHAARSFANFGIDGH